MKNKKEFKEFKKWCLSWQDTLSLFTWKLIDFKLHERDKESPYARVGFNVVQREFIMDFWGSKKGEKHSPKEIALHEMLHLFFAPLNIKEGTEHAMINSLIHVIIK